MWAYFKIELKHFFRNKKNIAVYSLFLFAVLFYAIRLAPAYDPIEKVDRDEIEARYTTRQEFLDRLIGKDISNSHPAVQEAYYAYSMINPLDKERLDSLENNDWSSYAEASSEWYLRTGFFALGGDNFTFNPLYFTKDNQFAKEDAFFAYLENSSRYSAFTESGKNLSVNLFEQRTALQTLERLLKGPLPIILLFACLLLTVDIVTKDRKYRTVLKGLPLADWKKVLMKFCVALVGSLGLIVPIGLGLLIIGFQSGFGNFHIPVPIYQELLFTEEMEIFSIITLGTYLAQNGWMILLWFTAIIAIVLFLSIVIRTEFLNLFVVIIFIFGEYFYRNRGVGFFWSIENYPTTYVQTGNVIGGYQNYFYTTTEIAYGKGLLLIGAISFVFLLLSIVVTLFKKYQFIR